MTVFLVSLLSAIKEVKGPFVFDVEHGIALLAMQGNRASSHGEGEVSWFFSRCGGNLAYILELQWGWPFKTLVCSATSGLLSSCDRQLGILLEVWQGNRDASRGKARNPGSLSGCHRDIGIPIYIQEESGIVSFCNIELHVPLEFSKGCEASCQDEVVN